MQFGNPIGLIPALCIPFVAYHHWSRSRRVPRLVAGLFLWKRAIALMSGRQPGPFAAVAVAALDFSVLAGLAMILGDLRLENDDRIVHPLHQWIALAMAGVFSLRWLLSRAAKS